MRLFIAINFSEEVKDALCETIADLRAAALRGRYTARENLHLTLAFIGESSRAEDILDVMEDVAADTALPAGTLEIALSGAGVFGGRGGDLHWVGVANTPELKSLAARLAAALRAEGFAVEKRRFTPHVTIGREVVLGAGGMGGTGGIGESEPADGAAVRLYPARMDAAGMSLMRSDRAGGKLVYTEIGFVPFT
ncbi:MAG: RNA 2',3'-cyclic phosphodiesterase [Clostridiales Family XIII bacterium]|jgi:2'-5' RNA ligase|nr:RNA 2',3'-cyclic phosphodiesterase [Clostridiales Family XIII bacterium]